MSLPNDTLIGSYRIVRTIGEGGMATVYEVEHTTLGVHYALKTFTFDPKEDEDGMLRAKFVDEGKLLARLKHENIVHVFDLAFDVDRRLLYFVMDLVLYTDGNPYTVDDVQREEIDEDIVFTWFEDVCKALDYGHSQGIVHRDVKAANLLIRQDRHVVLADFGISKIFGGKLHSELNPSHTSRIEEGSVTVLGTPHLMAPEVDAGAEATPAADAYSVGAMMFELLTGKWFDECEDPRPLLEGYRYDWASALALFLDDDPAERPENYMELVAQMREDRERREKAEKRKKRLIRWIIIVLGAILALAPLSIAYFGWRELNNLPADKSETPVD